MQIGILIACAALIAAAPAQPANDTTTKSGKPGDAAAIEQLRTGWITAWNRHQPEALAALFSETGDMMNPMGREARGHAQVMQLFQEEHAGHLHDSTFASTCEAPRFLGADVAVVDCAFTVDGVKGPGPTSMRGHTTSVDVRDASGWKIASLRAMFPQQPGAGAPAGRAPPPLAR